MGLLPAFVFHVSAKASVRSDVSIDVLLDPDQTMLDSAKVYNDLMQQELFRAR